MSSDIAESPPTTTSAAGIDLLVPSESESENARLWPPLETGNPTSARATDDLLLVLSAWIVGNHPRTRDDRTGRARRSAPARR